MDQFTEKLNKNSKLIFSKSEYYREKVASKTNFVEKKAKEVYQLGVFPTTIEKETVKIEGITCNFFQGILNASYDKFNKSKGYYRMSNLNYIEDFDKRLFCIGKYLSKDNSGHTTTTITITNNSQIYGYRVIAFTRHYIDRFKERNSAYITMIGDPREAIIYDLLSKYTTIPNMEVTKSFKSDEEITKMLNVLGEFSEMDEETVKKYINFEDLVCVKRTAKGYGIYSMRDDVITMITWLNDSMLTSGQKKLFDFYS